MSSRLLDQNQSRDTMRRLITLLLAFGLLCVANAQDKFLCRVPDVNEVQAKSVFKHKDVTAYKPNQYLDVVLTQVEIDELTTLGFNPEIRVTTQDMINNIRGDRTIEGYHNYEEVVAILQQYQADYPDICKLYDLGDSQGKIYAEAGNSYYDDYNHDIWGLKISDNVEQAEDEPAIFYMGAHHAREPISTEVVMAVLEHIFDNYGSDDQITNNVDNSEIWVVPIVNPNGQKYVLDEIDTWWRKNTRDNDESGTINDIDGVDPNRNYGWEWGGAGVSFDMYEDTYPGPERFSEPEIQAMRNMLDSHHFISGITYHSYSELVLFPYGYASGVQAPDHEILEDLAVQLANSIPKINGSGYYTPQQSLELYPASGVTDDWAYGEHGIFSYCVELGVEFIPLPSLIPQIQDDNIEAAMILLDRMNHNMVKGHITDGVTGEPLQAQVTIDVVDNNGNFRKPYQSNETFGSYYRFLLEGEYDIYYSAYGYIPQLIENVEIVPEQATIVDVALMPAQSTTINGHVFDALTSEPIEGALIEFTNNSIEPVYTSESGDFTFEEIFEGSYIMRISATDYCTHTEPVSINEFTSDFVFGLYEAIQEDFENELGSDWQFEGDAAWSIVTDEAYEGEQSLKSDNINHNQQAILTISKDISFAGEISFFRKVSSESGYDFLTFYIDNEEQGQWSGELSWEHISFPVSEGMHEFKWVYSKDVGTASGSDCAWIDLVTFPVSIDGVSVNAGGDQAICHDQICNITTSSALNYSSLSWTSSGDGWFSEVDVLTPSYTPGTQDISNGEVTLTLTASSESGAIDNSMLLTIDNCDGIEKTDHFQELEVYPNPAESYVIFDLSKVSMLGMDSEIQIYNSQMRIVKRIQLGSEQQINVNTQDFSPGMYMYVLKSSKDIGKTGKLIIM